MISDPTKYVDLIRAEGERSESLQRQAGDLRDARFGRNVFVRGVLEISNFCRENCSYCGMRRDNRELARYRLGPEELFEELMNHLPKEVTDLNIQAGEDPVAVRKTAVPLIRMIKQHTNLGVSACLGTLSDKDYADLREAGADYYIIKLETGNAQHFREMEAPGNLEERLAAIRRLAATDWYVSSGFIYGLPGQTPEIVTETLETLRTLPLVGWSVSPFIPGSLTPTRDHHSASLQETINCMALMRLLTPDRIIPAVSAMTIVGEDGYVRALRAGANLATINLTPAGERGDYVIYRRRRNIMNAERILREIEAAGCVPSTTGLSEHLRSVARAA